MRILTIVCHFITVIVWVALIVRGWNTVPGLYIVACLFAIRYDVLATYNAFRSKEPG